MHVMDSFSLKGKTALVVGGAGLYGRQITTALAQAGAKTYITSRKQDQLSQLKQEFKEDGIDIEAVYMDQSDENTIVNLKDQLLKTENRIDILVNNAVGRVTDGWNDDTANFSRSMDINATGIYAITKIFGNVMEQQKSGSIINIGSIHGMIGPDHTLYEGLDFHGFAPDYFFHKGGMINFTRFVASYYGRSGVRCNCVSPGGIQSYRTPPTFVKRYSDRTLLGRMANESDLMGVIVFLASDASAYVTGTNIPVDGGYTAK